MTLKHKRIAATIVIYAIIIVILILVFDMTSNWLEKISPCLRMVLHGETQISSTGNAETPCDWVEPSRVIYDHELVVFSKGNYIVEIEGIEYSCPQHTYIIVPCGRLHASWSTGERGHRYWAHFDWIWQEPQDNTPIFTYHPAKPHTELYRQAPDFISKKIQYGQIQAPEKIYDLLERLCTLQYSNDSYNRLNSRPIFLEILLELLHPHYFEDQISSSILDPAYRVRELIKQLVFSGRDIPAMQELASTLGYSYSHLCREFHSKYGIPPLKYVHALQISRAKALLSDTDLSISEISYRVGFNDSNYFTQLFKKTTGLTPSLFRRTKWNASD